MNHFFVWALFSAWCGIAWRFRGGAFTTLTGLNPGTDGARAIGAAMIGLPLALLAHDWRVLAVVPAIMLGLMLTGWGPFQGMGTEGDAVPERSWMRWLPKHMGLRPDHFGEDFVGMMEAGIGAVAPAALISLWFGAGCGGASILGAGFIGFPLAYTLALIGFPTLPRFARGQSWGEVGAGMVLGAALFYAAGCVH